MGPEGPILVAPPLTRKVRGCAGIVSDGARQAGCPGSDTSAELTSIRRTFGRSVGGGIMILSLMSVRRSVIRSWRRLRRPTLGRLLWASVALHVVVGLGILAWLARESSQVHPAVPGAPDRGAASRRAGAAARPARDAAGPQCHPTHATGRAPRSCAAPARAAAERGQAARAPATHAGAARARDSTASGPGPSHAAGGGPGARASPPSLQPRRLRRPHRLRPPRLLRPPSSRRHRRSGLALPLPEPRAGCPPLPGPRSRSSSRSPAGNTRFSGLALTCRQPSRRRRRPGVEGRARRDRGPGALDTSETARPACR